MQSANAKKFRSELKDYMDAAIDEPVRIHRRDGHNFILMAEEIYDEFRNEIQSLQRRLLGIKRPLHKILWARSHSPSVMVVIGFF